MYFSINYFKEALIILVPLFLHILYNCLHNIDFMNKMCYNSIRVIKKYKSINKECIKMSDKNLDSKTAIIRKEELNVVLKWKIVPQIILEEEYRVTIAYSTGSSNSQDIKVLGYCKGSEISKKILSFFDKFLTQVTSFGLLLESRVNEEFKNWDISFSKNK